MKDIMLDLETFGNSKDSVIVQIGTCYFDRYSGEIGETLCLNIDVDSSLKEGFDVWGSTLYWWMKQGDKARKSIMEEPRYAVRTAINQVNGFLKKADQIWSHATFDFVMLMGHFEKLGIKPSFHYRAARDLRTLVDLADLPKNNDKLVRTDIQHNALDDCLYQVQYAVECFRALKKEIR